MNIEQSDVNVKKFTEEELLNILCEFKQTMVSKQQIFTHGFVHCSSIDISQFLKENNYVTDRRQG
jgi:hypothetical protein